MLPQSTQRRSQTTVTLLFFEAQHLPRTGKLHERLHESHAPVVGLLLCSFVVKLERASP